MADRAKHTNQFADKGLFAVFALVGGLIVILLRQTQVPILIVIAIPVGFILVYATLTTTRFTFTRFRLRYDQAGDNCYYLGFIYTLISLGLALYSFNQSSVGNAREIVQNFGIALVTTVVGIVLRVILHQMRQDPHDVEERSRDELRAASANVVGHLQGMVKDTVSFRQMTQTEIKHFLYESRQVAEEYQESLKEFSSVAKSLVGQVRGLTKQVDEIEIGPDMVKQIFAPVTTSAGQSATSLDNFALATSSHGAQLEEAIRKIGDVTKQMSDAAEGLDQLKNLPETMGPTLEAIATASEGIQSLQTAALEVAERLNKTANTLVRLDALEGVVERIEALSKKERRHSLTGLLGRIPFIRKRTREDESNDSS